MRIDQMLWKVLERDQSMGRDFDEEGSRGFRYLWLARRAMGRIAPFGPILHFGETNASLYDTGYYAIFSRSELPRALRSSSESFLVPAMFLSDKYRIPCIEWATSEGEGGYGGQYARIFRFHNLPVSIQRRLRHCLGPDFPCRCKQVAGVHTLGHQQ